jgi:hypothetical protein
MIALLLAAAITLPTKPTHTPGVVRPLTTTQVCSTKWGKDRRHVTEGMKREIAARYGLTRTDIKARGKGPCCEVDHLIPRELGGADDVDNLWPQPWADATVKDHDENRLHRAVCAGELPLRDAQDQMRRWHR